MPQQEELTFSRSAKVDWRTSRLPFGEPRPGSPAPHPPLSHLPLASTEGSSTANLNEIGVRLWTACSIRAPSARALIGIGPVSALARVGKHKATYRG